MKVSIELEKKASLTMTDSLIGEFSRTKLVGYGLNNFINTFSCSLTIF